MQMQMNTRLVVCVETVRCEAGNLHQVGTRVGEIGGDFGRL